MSRLTKASWYQLSAEEQATIKKRKNECLKLVRSLTTLLQKDLPKTFDGSVTLQKELYDVVTPLVKECASFKPLREKFVLKIDGMRFAWLSTKETESFQAWLKQQGNAECYLQTLENEDDLEGLVEPDFVPERKAQFDDMMDTLEQMVETFEGLRGVIDTDDRKIANDARARMKKNEKVVVAAWLSGTWAAGNALREQVTAARDAYVDDWKALKKDPVSVEWNGFKCQKKRVGLAVLFEKEVTNAVVATGAFDRWSSRREHAVHTVAAAAGASPAGAAAVGASPAGAAAAGASPAGAAAVGASPAGAAASVAAGAEAEESKPLAVMGAKRKEQVGFASGTVSADAAQPMPKRQKTKS